MADVATGGVREGSNNDLLTKEKSYMFEERLETAGRLRQLGNERFGGGHMEEAAEAYQRALYHVDFDELQINFDFSDKHRDSVQKAKLPILLNLCQCLAKSGSGGAGRAENAGRALERAGEAIELDATCAKAWFWRGKARMDAGDLTGSATDLEEAAKLAPGDKSVRLALKSLSIKQKEQAAVRQKMWGGIFKGGGTASRAPGRQQLEQAKARARGEVDVAGGGGRRKKGREEGWGLFLMAAAGGMLAFAVAGFLAGKFA